MTAIRCRGAAEIVCDARDRPLQPDESTALRDHLESCDRCRLAAQQFRELFAQLDELLVRHAQEETGT